MELFSKRFIQVTLAMDPWNTGCEAGIQPAWDTSLKQDTMHIYSHPNVWEEEGIQRFPGTHQPALPL